MMRTILTYILILFSFIAFAQTNVEFTKENFPDKTKLKEALHAIEDGDEYFNDPYAMQGHFRLALKEYLKADKLNPNNALLNYKIGYCYMYTVKKMYAIKYLEKAKKLNPDVNPKLYFILGEAYHLEYDFDYAIKYYEAYKKHLPTEERASKMALIKKKIAECNVGKKLMAERTRAFIDNIGKPVNSKYPEYTPIISADESVMLFTSRRPNTTGGQMSEAEQEYYEDIYISYNKEGKWQEPINMGKPINDIYHDATVSISGDGQKMFVYKSKKGGDIYECELKGNTWSKPKKLPKPITSDYYEFHACYTNDLKTIYFVSDRPGGQGGRDIYMCKKDSKDKWGDAINLGPVINTQYDEAGVFISPDGKYMYFSSKGHNTMGGYDIFRSEIRSSGRPTKPENIGYPINTPGDDVYFVVAANGQHGYYASERLGGQGSKDIYLVTFLLTEEKPVVINTEDNLLASRSNPISETFTASVVKVDNHLPTILKGVITDYISKKPIGATIELVDNVKNIVIATFESNEATGKYLVTLPSGANYGIAVKKTDYLFHSENFEIPEVSEYKEIVKNIELKNLKPGNSIVLKNIFFDFNKATIRPESNSELERLVKLLTDIPTIKIEISGHTDNKGDDAYNMKLSDARAKAVVAYLTSKGIAANRLTAKGYGESKPIAKNNTKEGRQENRRTEFKILSE